jgi:phosphatidylserine/phosphatidylglycerophosphate/cardiolipin synthase-like enzyme
MQTHIGQGVGKYIEEELFKTEKYVKVCSPNISYSLSKKLFNLLDNQIKIQVIISDIITGNKNSNQTNFLAKEILQKNDNIKYNFEYKAISTKDIPLIHAKIYVIDGNCAITGSANLTENSFQNFVEYILIIYEINLVKKIENDFDMRYT